VLNFGMQNISHLVEEKHLQIRGWRKGVGNSMENWPYLENGERYGQGYKTTIRRNKNRRPWMTLKVTVNQYGRLS